MKPLRKLTVFCLAALSLFAFSTGPAFADAHTDCAGADADTATSDLAAMRTAVVCLANRERISRGMGALKEQSVLTSVAQAHSADMAKNNYFAHVDLSGGQPWDRAKKAGYATGYVGENIVAGTVSPYESMSVWMGSAGHCANILSPQYVDIGIGIATDAASEYGIYYTMVLGGNDTSAPKVTVKCPFSQLASGTVSPVNSLGSGGKVKTKVSKVKRLSDGRYRVEGKITPAAKGTTVKLTVSRGKKTTKYSVKTTKTGSFTKTVRAPGGSGKVTVTAKA